MVGNMSINVDAGLLAVAVEALGITVPIRSARPLKGGGVEVWTRDGRQVWKPPRVRTAPDPTPSGAESVSVPRAPRKRAASAKRTGGEK